MAARWRRRASRSPAATDRGQAAVELVLVLPVVVAGLLLVLQVAIVVRAQVLVVEAARSGARAAAVEGTVASATEAAKALPGLAADRVEVDARVGDVGELARVDVRYRVQTEVPLVGALLGDPIVRAETTMRVEGPAG